MKPWVHRSIVTALLAAGAAVAALVAVHRQEQPDPVWPSDGLECAILKHPRTDSTKALLAGYEWYLLKKMASGMGTECSIRMAREGESLLDSLQAGALDIVVLPRPDSTSKDGFLFCNAPDSMSCWVMRNTNYTEFKAVRNWLSEYRDREEYQTVHNRFHQVYSPYRSRPRQSLSPYDSLLRAEADSIGWDWKLLAALVWTESHFHIEASSPRGASGLMQMMPATAARYGADDLLDPQQSIRAGTRYLKRLGEFFEGNSADKGELCKFVLAAYNAGHGRIKDCIRYASLKENFNGRWEDVVGVIPEMRDSSILDVDTVRLGIFKGYETIAYVDGVLSVYEEFKRIAPK